MSARRAQLDTLLRIRRIEEDRAKAEMAGANARQRQALEKATAAEAELERASQPAPSGDLNFFLSHQHQATAAAGSLMLAYSAHEDACQATEQAREQVRQATMRSEGLQRLVDRVAQERFEEMLAADQRTAEESRTGKKPKGRR